MREELADWAPSVYRFALRLTLDRHLAEDLAQEALLRAWRCREQLHDLNRIRPWLFHITANLWRDRLRRQQSPIAQASSLSHEPVSIERPEDRLTREEQVEKVLRHLDELPDRQREVLYLSAHEGLSTREIAEILSITPEAVKASRSLARQRMRQLLNEDETL